MIFSHEILSESNVSKMDEINNYRINDIKQTIEKMTNKKLSYEKRIRRANKVSATTSSISLAIASIATALGSASLAISAIPTAPIVVCLASSCAISTGIGKIFTKKQKQYTAKLTKLESKADY